MKKYIFIYKSELMSSLQYIFNIFTGLISYFVMIFIFINLWNYLYDDPTELINGYNKNQMIWYVIITEILWMSLSGRQLCKDVSKDIKSGNVVYNINKPYNYVGYILMNHLGKISIKFIFFLIFGILMGYLFLGSLPTLNIISILCILLTLILALIISTLLSSFIGLFSFFIEDSSPFYWLYSKIILVLGTLFPIEFFPKIIQPILKYSPIYAVNYGPAKLFVDFELNTFLSILIAQIIYLVITLLVCNLVYRKGVKNLNVNGG